MRRKFRLFYPKVQRECLQVQHDGTETDRTYRDIDFYAPYPALEESISKHITYLDTIGRPKITLKYAQLTDKHGGNIYVSYSPDIHWALSSDC